MNPRFRKSVSALLALSTFLQPLAAMAAQYEQRVAVPTLAVQPGGSTVTTPTVPTLPPGNPGASNGVSLSSSSAQLVFAGTAAGATATKTITLTNTGSAAGPVTLWTTGSAAFSSRHNCPASLAVNASCDVSIDFKPTGGGAMTGQMVASSGASNVAVTLEGMGLGSNVVLSSPSLTFGTVMVGDTGTARLTLTNSGNANATLAMQSLTAPVSLDSASTCGSSLNAGASCTLDFNYTPLAVGNLSQTVNLTLDGKAASLALTGTSQGLPVASLSATSLSYGSQDTGSTTARTVRLTNAGLANLTFTGAPTLTGDASFAFPATAATTCDAVLAPGAYCDTTVEFKPTASAGSFYGSLKFHSNISGGTTVSLSGTVVENTGTLTVTSGSSTDFGTVVVGTPVTRTFMFSATGGKALTNVSGSVAGSAALSITSNSCGTAGSPVSVPGGSACYLSVTYAPSGSETLSDATLTVNSSASNTPHTLSLTGSALVASFTLSTSTLSTFSALAGGSSAAKGVLVQSTGSADLLISSVTTTGAYTAALVDCGLNSAVPAQGCTVNVMYTPTLAGSNDAGTMSVVTNAGTKSVTLSGGTSSSVTATGTLIASTTGTSASTVSVVAPAGYALTDATSVQLRTGSTVKATSSSATYDGATRTVSASFDTVALPAAGSYTLAVMAGSVQLATATFTMTAPITVSVSDTSNVAITSLAFGSVTTATTKSFRIINSSTSRAALTVNGMSSTGSGSPFSVTAVAATVGNTGATCTSASNMVIPAGKSCDVTVQVQNIPGTYSSGFTLAFTTANGEVLNPSSLGTATNFALPVTATVSNSSGLYLNFEGASVTTDTSDANVPLTVSGTITKNTLTSRNGMSSALMSSGYMTVASPHSSFGYGTGDFTIESWVNLTSRAGVLFEQRTGTSSVQPYVGISASGNLLLYIGQTLALTSPTAVDLNVWTHIALVRRSASTTLYINGQSQGSVADSNNYGASNRLWIGSNYNGAYPLGGSIDDFRVVKGSALYTGNFTLPMPATTLSPTTLSLPDTAQGATSAGQTVTVKNTGNHPMVVGTLTPSTHFGITANTCTSVSVPAGGTCTFGVTFAPTTTGYLTGTVTVNHGAPGGPSTLATVGNALTSTGTDPYWGNVVTLMRGDGPSGTDAIYDNKGVLSFNMVGTGTAPSISSTDSKFGGTSMYFAGGKYLQATSTSLLATSNFTVEFWAKRTSGSGRVIGTDGWWVATKYQNFVEGYNGVVLSHCGVIAGGAGWCTWDSASIVAQMTGAAMTSWHHVVLTRTGNVLREYVDGTLQATSDMASAYSANGTVNLLEIGQGWVGYIDDLRVSTVSRYGTATSIPVPAAPLAMSGSILVPSSATLDTGTAVVGAALPNKALTLTNYGTTAVTISGISISSGTGVFSQTNNCGSTLAVGASCTVTVASIAGAVGLFTGTLTVASNANKASLNIPLTNTGTAGDVLNSAFEGSNNGTTFTDAAGAVYTRYGSAVTSTAQYKAGASSLSLPATADYLGAANPGKFDFGTNNFTAEAWVYPTAAASGWQLVAGTLQWYQGYKNGWMLGLTTSQTAVFYGANGTTALLTSAANAVPLNQWTHLAVTRSGSNFTLWVNGVSAATASSAITIARPTGPNTQELRIGSGIGDNTVMWHMPGYVDNVRITSGTARYTAAFEPRPAVAMSASSLNFGAMEVRTGSVTQTVTATNNGALPVSNMSAAVTAGATDYSVTSSCAAIIAPGGTCTFTVKYIATASGTRTGTLTVTTGGAPATATVSLTGTATGAQDTSFASVNALLHLDGNATDVKGIQTTAAPNVTYSTGKFGQAADLNGTNAYLTASNIYPLTNANWTIEMWVKPNAFNAGLIGQYGASDMQWQWNLANSTTLTWAGQTYTLATPITTGTWHHMALVRSAGTTYVYVDGVRATGSTTAAVTMFSTGITIGSHWLFHSPLYQLNGSIDDVRITGGVARYTGTTYTVPTAAFGNW